MSEKALEKAKRHIAWYYEQRKPGSALSNGRYFVTSPRFMADLDPEIEPIFEVDIMRGGSDGIEYHLWAVQDGKRVAVVARLNPGQELPEAKQLLLDYVNDFDADIWRAYITECRRIVQRDLRYDARAANRKWLESRKKWGRLDNS